MPLASRETAAERTGTMVRQTTNGGEVETGNVDESARYFDYLRTLADLTAIASIMAVQVISGLSSSDCATWPCLVLARLRSDVSVDG